MIYDFYTLYDFLILQHPRMKRLRVLSLLLDDDGCSLVILPTYLNYNDDGYVIIYLHVYEWCSLCAPRPYSYIIMRLHHSPPQMYFVISKPCRHFCIVSFNCFGPPPHLYVHVQIITCYIRVYAINHNPWYTYLKVG